MQLALSLVPLDKFALSLKVKNVHSKFFPMIAHGNIGALQLVHADVHLMLLNRKI